MGIDITSMQGSRGVMQDQEAEDVLLNGIATRCKDGNSFFGKFRRVILRLEEDIGQVNALRLKKFEAELAAQGLTLPLQSCRGWNYNTLCQAMHDVGCSSLLRVVITRDEITVEGDNMPTEPLDPGIRY